MDHFQPHHFRAQHFGAVSLAGIGGGIPLPPYTITKFWQTRMFKHKADIWEPVRSSALDGDVSPAAYLPRFQAVPCWCTRMPSASQVEMFGRTEQDDLFTRDLWFFHEAQEIGDSWLIVLRTVDSHGVQHPDYGKAWICAGDDRVFVDSIGDEGHRQIVAVAQPVMPEGVS